MPIRFVLAVLLTASLPTAVASQGATTPAPPIFPHSARRFAYDAQETAWRSMLESVRARGVVRQILAPLPPQPVDRGAAAWQRRHYVLAGASLGMLASAGWYVYTSRGPDAVDMLFPYSLIGVILVGAAGGGLLGFLVGSVAS